MHYCSTCYVSEPTTVQEDARMAIDDDGSRAPDTSARREELAEAATDWALDHGLIGLRLRPLAGALGTSDRMLIYHFHDKDALVAAILRTSNDRSLAVLRSLPPSPDVRRAVLDLWAAHRAGQLERCQRLYVEAAALGLFGQEPYARIVRDSNRVWVAAVAAHLESAGCPAGASERLANLVDAAFAGFLLDQPLGEDRTLHESVEDLAEAAAQVAEAAVRAVR